MSTKLAFVGVNAGFLEHSRIEFADGLTCIIGARGTCKSTLIETIRFIFDTDSDRIAILTGVNPADVKMPQFKLITTTLGAGTARCGVIRGQQSETTDFVLEREAGDSTRIFINDVREHANREVLHEIEIFSQGDLQRIANEEKDEMRLALIDRPNRAMIAPLRTELVALTDELKRLGPELRLLRAQKATLRREVVQLDVYSAQLQRSRSDAPPATPELETEQLAFEHRQRTLEDFQLLNHSRLAVVANLDMASSRLAEIIEISQRLNAAASIVPEAMDALESLNSAIEALAAAALRIKALGLGTLISAVEAKFEQQSATYYRLRQEQQAVNESLKQQQALQRQVDHLTRQAQELSKIDAAEKNLIEQRRDARRRLSEIDDRLFELRIAEVDTINALHADTVQLALSPYTATHDYARKLSDLLGGSRIRAQEEVAQAIVERLAPSELIDIVETVNAQHLADVLDRDIGQMTRVVSHLADAPDLYSLESELPSTKLDIVLYDDGHPKRVEELSEGQKATALLPIILRDLPYPLIFDQPEDDLDNKFITTLIKTIRTLKHRRQLIFVTHNANIPVLGEADRVVVMRMESALRAAAPKVGSVDECKQEILDLLEGGAEAFSARGEHYKSLLIHEAQPRASGKDSPVARTEK